MKKTQMLYPIAFSLLLCSMTACSVYQRGQEDSRPSAASEPVLESSAERAEPVKEVKVTREAILVTQKETAEDVGENRTLIVYFSRWGNTDYPDDVDASASASIVIDQNERYGTTEYAANFIRQATGGELYRIETAQMYTEDFDELREVNHEEARKGYLPELKESDLDLSGYDRVFVGYPVWASNTPQAVVSFLTQYDLSGKTVIPFCTHDGYGAGSSYRTVTEACPGANVLDGIAIEAGDVPAAGDTIENWLTDLGLSGTAGSATEKPDSGEQTGTPIQITIGDRTLDGILYNTALAEEIKGYFPLTISMSGYGGREYYGGVDFYPENLEGGQKNFENGDITYCEAHHNMAIFYAQTDRPNLSVDVIPIGRVTSDLSVFDSLGSREEITFSLK